jgi:sirohydrochlorin cobaltochelatase
VLLIGHGTRDPVGTEQFFQLAKYVADSVSPVPTEAALLEFQHPTIPEAWQSLQRRGVRHVHVAPLLLFAAGHAKQDIPTELEKCRASSVGVTFDQTRPLSRHPAIIELVARRVQDALDCVPGPAERVAVVMVGRGNRDPCAQADMKLMTEVVRRRVHCGEMTTAFYAMATPPLPTVLDSVASTKRFDQIVVYPHLLFQGRLLDAIKRQTQEASEQHSNVRFVTAEHLGPHPQVAEAIRARVAQTASPAIAAQCR